jgi:hypothetical protein
VRPLGVLRGGHAGAEHKRSRIGAPDWPTACDTMGKFMRWMPCANNGSGCHIHSAMKLKHQSSHTEGKCA